MRDFTAPVDFSFETAWAVVDDANLLAADGDLDETYPLASVTKVIAAWIFLQAVDDGVWGLDEVVFDGGRTVRHLISHAAGLPFEAGPAVAAPEVKRTYSNYDFDILGAVLEERAPGYFAQRVPEGITIAGSPAASGRGSVDALAAFAQKLVRGEGVSEGLWAEATSPVFPELAGIVPGYGRQVPNWWGLGFELRGTKSPHWTCPEFPPTTFGHFGQAGSFLWVDPTLGAAGVFLGAQPFGPEHKEKWPALTCFMRGIVGAV